MFLWKELKASVIHMLVSDCVAPHYILKMSGNTFGSYLALIFGFYRGFFHSRPFIECVEKAGMMVCFGAVMIWELSTAVDDSKKHLQGVYRQMKLFQTYWNVTCKIKKFWQHTKENGNTSMKVKARPNYSSFTKRNSRQLCLSRLKCMKKEGILRPREVLACLRAHPCPSNLSFSAIKYLLYRYGVKVQNSSRSSRADCILCREKPLELSLITEWFELKGTLKIT